MLTRPIRARWRAVKSLSRGPIYWPDIWRDSEPGLIAFSCTLLTCSRHHMPIDGSSTRSVRSRGSISDISSPLAASLYMPHPSTQSNHAVAHSAGSMYTGSLVERETDYRTQSVPPSLHDHLSSQPIGTAPCGLLPDLLYGLSPSGDSLCSSSDSCYSPISDYYRAPRPLPPQYGFGPEIVPRPHSALESNYPSIETSPMSVGPPTPGNGPTSYNTFDPHALGFIPETQCIPPVSPF